MQRISVHISEETKRKLELAAKFKNKVEAELIREVLDIGLRVIAPKFNSAKALLDLVKKAEKLPSRPEAPRDVSENLDYYAWGGPKK